MREHLCKHCGSNKHLSLTCFQAPRKRISQRGQRALEYEAWRDTIAIPYLDEHHGRMCHIIDCGATTNLDVAHIKGRGSHPGLKMNVHNIRYLCRYHHRLETDGKLVEYE